MRYMEREEIQRYLADGIARRGMKAFDGGEAQAEVLLLKRAAFHHEAEVRLIYIEGRDVPDEPVVRVPIEPNDVFDDVTYDSRLLTFERRDRETVARSLGYRRSISESDLYQNTLLLVAVNRLPTDT